MAHILIIIDEKAACSRAKIEQLKDYAHDLDEFLNGTITPEQDEQAHELLEHIQGMFTALCNGTSLAECASLDEMIVEAESILE